MSGRAKAGWDSIQTKLALDRRASTPAPPTSLSVGRCKTDRAGGHESLRGGISSLKGQTRYRIAIGSWPAGGYG